MEENSITRPIYWNTPEIYQTYMYFLFFAAITIFMIGIIGKIHFITGKKGPSSILHLRNLFTQRLNWNSFFQTIFFTGKVPRSPGVGIFHAFIYYGFIILWIATDLVKIHADTPFAVFQGWVYIGVSFLADLAGVAILVGIGVAYYRRYIKRPNFLQATNPKQELFMYGMLFLLVVLGFALESIRIFSFDMPYMEKFYSPIGWIGAVFIQTLNYYPDQLTGIYQGIWLIHMINTMVFIACIPYSKFFHIITLPFNALITKDKQGAVLSPMNFEDENAETFGLGKISELSMKQNLDLLSCVECGRCTVVCPAYISGKNLNPKTIITKIRDFKTNLLDQGKTDGDIWKDPIYVSNELDACTTCGACMEECPANIEHVNLIMEAKRFKVLTRGEIPETAADAINKIKNNGNPWGIAQEDRLNWAENLNIPIASPDKKIDYLYYVGCAGSYDAANQKVVRDTLALLKKANVDFAVMGKTEKCNGDPIRRFGDEYTFYEIAIENIANMKKYKFDKVVTHCPHCLHTIGKEYAKFENGDFETIHHTELLADLIKQGRINPEKTVEQSMTYHDPCYLGRHHGTYDAPREILEAIPGVSTKEMELNKDKSLCCGMGGGNMWYELPEGDHLAQKRLQQIGQTNTSKMATSCSYCMINFNSTKAQIKETENMEIEDVATVLAKSVL
ncbi:MAG: heterodisulfide reductase-related iron-sulfur binding cluster [Halobacteriovoraceae bacterium]|nr:heterodisulfide reductase-related iron-sulfur binding cluster [Halobacteriovoraceae bacterium]